MTDILLINPNTTRSITDLVLKAARGFAGKGTRLRAVTGTFGPRYIASRVGYAIGKRVGTAVVRNRTRRRLREITRTLPLPPGYDLVITGQPIAADASYQALEEAMSWCVRRAGVLTAPNVTNTGETS